MAKRRSVMSYFNSCIFVVTLALWCSSVAEEDRKVHIVYMGSLPTGDKDEYSPSLHHLSILQEVGDSSSTELLIRSYKRSFNGFAAMLTDQERQKLAGVKGVVSVFPSRPLQLHTTRSWDFMGFSETLSLNLPVESDVVVGVLDTGIWPESESFNDKGFGPPAPKKWKGACEGGKDFTCNNKIIGARYYSSKFEKSARDEEGHGTHTASIAAGNKVNGVSFYGLGQGEARGGAPSARIAAYKVCNPDSTCDAAEILAAFDDAIADGVDVITISIGGNVPLRLNRDPIAIGAFHALEKGILTVNSAGNLGSQGLIVSVAPWMVSVAASSTDRQIIDKVILGNNNTIVGNAVNSFSLNGTKFPIVYGKDASSQCDENDARTCHENCLDNTLVKGKIVLCDYFYDGLNEAIRAGAMGLITQDDISEVVPIPVSALSSQAYDVVKSYVNSTKLPQGNILPSEELKDVAAPVVATFSSRGPNIIVAGILKPDITAPGIGILAAFSPVASPSGSPHDKRSIKYNFQSGTSMACPHVAGAAAYVKALHPSWSPSAIKSALMTTAWLMNATKNPGGEFSYGSGHLNPAKAADPGLVYETFKEDYINMLCSMGYDEQMVKLISGDNSTTCPPKNTGHVKVTAATKDLNYPSMAVQVLPKRAFKTTFNRTATNVGLANSTYVAKVDTMKSTKIDVKVEPSALSFKSLNEKKGFVVTVSGEGLQKHSMVSASLVWSDGIHNVRSPIVVYTNSRSIDLI